MEVVSPTKLTNDKTLTNKIQQHTGPSQTVVSTYNRFTRRDGISFGLEPRDHLSFLHGGRQSGHVDLAKLAVGLGSGGSGRSCRFGGRSRRSRRSRSSTTAAKTGRDRLNVGLGLGNEGHGFADGCHIALLNDNLGEKAVFKGFHVHLK